jgi:UDP-N-acetylmuramate dehydrogenase
MLTIYKNEPLSKHTTFKTGGAADIFAVPSDAVELVAAVEGFRRDGTRFFILGNGSNVLFNDAGYRGAVISTTGLNGISLCGDGLIRAGAGVLLKDLSAFAAERSLSGAEFAGGIPGSVGGAVFMNAGAYDSEIGNIFVEGEFLDGSGKAVTIKTDGMEFGYRTSAAQTGGLVVLSAVFKLTEGNRGEIDAKIKDLTRQREDKQPLEFGSAGSTFKRPAGHFAGKLIRDSGLAGFTIGGAQVSQKHCGFVINKGGATSADILNLIEHIKKTVHERFGVTLETEVKIIDENHKQS